MYLFLSSFKCVIKRSVRYILNDIIHNLKILLISGNVFTALVLLHRRERLMTLSDLISNKAPAPIKCHSYIQLTSQL